MVTPVVPQKGTPVGTQMGTPVGGTPLVSDACVKDGCVKAETNEETADTGLDAAVSPLPAHPLAASTSSPSPGIRSLEQALNCCQNLGMRLSRQRRSILELLWQTQEHLSARQIYDRLNQQGQEIGHTSVYQNLEALSAQGIIECVERADGRLYGNISDSHSHVNCLDTNQIVDIQIQLPAELIAQVEQQTGIKITDYRIDFFGYRQPAV